jgi:hypothetical protein
MTYVDEQAKNQALFRRLEAALLELQEAAHCAAVEHAGAWHLYDLARAVLGALQSKATLRDALIRAEQNARREREALARSVL